MSLLEFCGNVGKQRTGWIAPAKPESGLVPDAISTLPQWLLIIAAEAALSRLAAEKIPQRLDLYEYTS
jgi:hypothetical protein